MFSIEVCSGSMSWWSYEQLHASMSQHQPKGFTPAVCLWKEEAAEGKLGEGSQAGGSSEAVEKEAARTHKICVAALEACLTLLSRVSVDPNRMDACMFWLQKIPQSCQHSDCCAH